MTTPPVVPPHLRGHDAPPERILLLALLPIGDSLLNFVGGSTIWRRPCCRGTCAALRSLAVDTVLPQAEALLLPRRTAMQGQEQESNRGSDTPARSVARQTS